LSKLDAFGAVFQIQSEKWRLPLKPFSFSPLYAILCYLPSVIQDVLNLRITIADNLLGPAGSAVPHSPFGGLASILVL
jgi:hypothetical protein